MGREWQVTPTAAGFRYDSDLLGLDLPAPALVGAHQLDNAATAVACIERLRAAQFRIDDAAIAKGLASVEWPARLQKLTRGPLVEALPPGGELWLDGGHNEDCGLALARMAADWAKEPAPLPLYLIFGMLTTKDAVGLPAAAGAPRPRRARRADRRPRRLHAAGGLRTGGRGRPGLRARKRHRRGAGRPVGHPARADAHPDLRVALPRGRRAGPQRLSAA